MEKRREEERRAAVLTIVIQCSLTSISDNQLSRSGASQVGIVDPKRVQCGNAVSCHLKAHIDISIQAWGRGLHLIGSDEGLYLEVTLNSIGVWYSPAHWNDRRGG